MKNNNLNEYSLFNLFCNNLKKIIWFFFRLNSKKWQKMAWRYIANKLDYRPLIVKYQK